MIQRDWEEIRRQWQRAKEENRPYEGPQIYVYTITRIVPATIRDVIPRGATVLIEDIKEGDYRYFPYQALHTKASLEAAERKRKAALQKTCVMCGKQFEAKREGIVCCSPKCSMRHAYQMKKERYAYEHGDDSGESR